MGLCSKIYTSENESRLNVNSRTSKDIQNDTLIADYESRHEFHYWLEEIFENKGGKCGEFTGNENAQRFCQTSLELTEDILVRWEKICDVHSDRILYFDEDYCYLYDDINTVKKCRKLIEDGLYVYYWGVY